jgi:hypothetical protein
MPTWVDFIVAPDMANCIMTTLGYTLVMLNNDSVIVVDAPQSNISIPMALFWISHPGKFSVVLSKEYTFKFFLYHYYFILFWFNVRDFMVYHPGIGLGVIVGSVNWSRHFLGFHHLSKFGPSRF